MSDCRDMADVCGNCAHCLTTTEVQRQLDDLRAENVRLAARVEELETEAYVIDDDAQSALFELRQKLESTEATLLKESLAHTRAEADVVRLESERDTARAEAERITGLLACAHADLDAARAEVESLKAQLAEAQKERDCAQRRFDTEQDTRNMIQEHADAAEEQLRVAREALEKARREYVPTGEQQFIDAALSASTPKAESSARMPFSQGGCKHDLVPSRCNWCL